MTLAIRTSQSLRLAAEQVPTVPLAERPLAIPWPQIDQQPRLWRNGERNAATIPDLLANRPELARRRLWWTGLKARITTLTSSVDSPDGDAAAHPSRLLDLRQGRAGGPQLAQLVVERRGRRLRTLLITPLQWLHPRHALIS